MANLYTIKVCTPLGTTMTSLHVGLCLDESDSEQYYDLANPTDRRELAEDLEHILRVSEAVR